MKDLTDYFGSSPKTNSANAQCIEEKTNDRVADELKVQKMEKADELQDKKKRKKKKHKRKSDPAVRNVVDLLSKSLIIVSPNPSCNSNQSNLKENDASEENGKDKSNKPDKEQQSRSHVLSKNDSVETSDITIDKENDNSSKPENKVNAFQFMMESRNKSIGQNSPGKDQLCDATECDKKESKDILATRKNLFQNWSDKKGGSKRKRQQEEIEETINYKLEKRAKRLKKLLQVDDSKAAKPSVVKKAKRRIKRISTSSSENSQDCVLSEKVTETSSNTLIEIIEENTQDSVVNVSKIKETKQGLLSFFGVVNSSRKSETINKQIENGKKKEKITEKLETPKLTKKKLKFNGDMKKIISDGENSNDSSMVKELKSKGKRNNMCKEIIPSEKAKTPKTPSQTTKDDETFTPRSLKSWKMKIKITENHSDKEQDEPKAEEKRPQRMRKITNYSLLFSDESSNEDMKIASKKIKNKVVEVDDVICLDDDSDKKKKEPVKPTKVAPVFTKSTPKPKVAPEIVEARRQFLMSGIPDSLKKSIEKQQSIEEREYDIFPSISHVQQRSETEIFWDLSKPQLNLKHCSPLKTNKSVICTNITNSNITNPLNIRKEVEKVDKLKTLLNKIKSDNPNYPVYKSFRLISKKSGKTLGKNKAETKKAKRRGRKSASKDIEIVEDAKPETDSIDYAMWTDKYKPKHSEDIIGNSEGIKNLKKWLELWKNFCEENNTKKKKRLEYCSDSEFDTTDCDSRDSTKLTGNTVVVGGPCGSGKSTAIYAICNELGFNVIEVNASSKRTGKRLLQELQEATQSHQVRKKEQNMQSYLNSSKKLETKEQLGKMCVILIEDVDIVFEQDDGFVAALTQLVGSSKRPIVFTTTDTSPIFVQKFISQYEYISFFPLSSQSLATWLQLVCLVEGLYVNQGDIGSLLEFNKGDARRTLLQLQFWVQSGGQIVRDNLPVKIKATVVNMENLVDDEQEPGLEDGNTSQEVFIHSDCIRSFEIFRHHKTFRIPYYINLGLLWWNIPNILGVESCSDERLKRFRDTSEVSEIKAEKETSQNVKLSPIERRKLDFVSRLYDSLVFTDVSFKTLSYFDGFEPTLKNYNSEVRDSLELSEVMESYTGHKEFVHEVTHSLVNGFVEEYSRIEGNESVLNIAVPEKAERRWRAKMQVCEDVFREVLPLSTYTERKSVALDYMPTLRDISRSECRRASINTKRGNRFRNYLRGLGINYNDNTLKLACNILRENDF